MTDKPHSSDDEEPRRKPISSEDWHDLVDEILEDAIRSGAFDNLPGKGKPLDRRRNLYSGDTELAHKLLKNNNYTLPWIAGRNNILETITAFREQLRATWLRHSTEYLAASSEMIRMGLSLSWYNHLTQCRQEIATLNKRIDDVNLSLPVERIEVVKLVLVDELRRIGAAQEVGGG